MLGGGTIFEKKVVRRARGGSRCSGLLNISWDLADGRKVADLDVSFRGL